MSNPVSPSLLKQFFQSKVRDSLELAQGSFTAWRGNPRLRES